MPSATCTMASMTSWSTSFESSSRTNCPSIFSRSILQGFEVGEAREAGAEVVKGDPRAKRAQVLAHCVGVVEVGDHVAF